MLLLTVTEEIAETCLQMIFTSLCLNYHFKGSQLVDNCQWVRVEAKMSVNKEKTACFSHASFTFHLF